MSTALVKLGVGEGEFAFICIDTLSWRWPGAIQVIVEGQPAAVLLEQVSVDTDMRVRSCSCLEDGECSERNIGLTQNVIWFWGLSDRSFKIPTVGGGE